MRAFGFLLQNGAINVDTSTDSVHQPRRATIGRNTFEHRISIIKCLYLGNVL